MNFKYQYETPICILIDLKLLFHIKFPRSRVHIRMDRCEAGRKKCILNGQVFCTINDSHYLGTMFLII